MKTVLIIVALIVLLVAVAAVYNLMKPSDSILEVKPLLTIPQ